jgi:nitrate/TMAO reductase-like tetraheme cytochrome c subunit
MRTLWTLAALLLAWPAKPAEPAFQHSDRCVACHNGLATSWGEDVSIGFNWRASIMANSARDPYWQASVRRESMDFPDVRAAIEEECSACHMPVTHYEAKLRGRPAEVFSHLDSEDGVTCSVCHQISKEKLGSRESFNGEFVVDAPKSKQEHPEYGPFEIKKGQQRIMRTSSGGFLPSEEAHIKKSELCATCHTLYTTARGAEGGELPEQMPYLEWLHSDYRENQSCQDCHMPEVKEETPIAKVLGDPREGLHRHTFLGGNFLMERMLNRYRDELDVTALPQELNHAANETIGFLQSKTARIQIDRVSVSGGRLLAEVSIENLSGHKFPTAYPSRRAWLHVVVRDRDNKTLFESGALRADRSGAIEGNDNDTDPARFEPHYSEIDRADQVQIYEPILKDRAGRVTTGLLTAIGYLKDNRLLPHGFDKDMADKDIAVYGAASHDEDFRNGGDRIRYSVAIADSQGPFAVEAELWYQPIGYRWANNLKPYDAAEPHRFTGYYDAMAAGAAIVVARASVLK